MMHKEHSNEILNAIDLSDWITSKQIRQRIKVKFDMDISARTLRHWIYNYNQSYYANENDYCIVSCKKGYARTNRSDLIKYTEQNKMANAISMINEVRKSRKARGEHLNYKLILEETQEHE